MLFFLFKQKTAYEMRISDWSSDVCSSDLLVEQQDGGVLQHGAGDGDALALTAGEVAAARADLGVVAAGEGGDEIMGAGHAGGLFDLGIARAGAAVGDVGAQAVVEQQDLLADQAEDRKGVV